MGTTLKLERIEKLAPRKTLGEFHDRFGNKVTMYGAGNGLNGYGIILFDTKAGNGVAVSPHE